MDLIKLKWTVPKSSDGADLAVISDIHLGNRFHDHKSYRKNLEWLYEHKEYKILTTGDLIECSSKHTMGLPDQIISVEDQIESIIRDLEPLAKEKRIIGMIQGNHEERAINNSGVNITRDIARYLEVANLGISSIFYIRVKEAGSRRGQHYTMYAKHGSSFARRVGGKVNAMMNMSKTAHVDLYLYAHLHDLLHEVSDIYEVDRGSLRLKRKHYVMTGGYLLHGGYVEKKGYAPSGPSGSARIKFHTYEHRIAVKI